MEIVNKTFLITGASEGIGEQIAYALAAEKAKLILLARNEKRLEVVKKAALKFGADEVRVITCDLQDVVAIKDALKSIDRLDGIINNAGIWQKVSDLENISEEEILAVVQTNLSGLILLTKYALPLLKQSSEAILINISSRSGYSAQAGQSVYTSTKYGVRGFTEVLREDLKETNVHVAGVYQGGTNTKMFEKAGENWPEERYQKFIPADELAKIITFMITRPANVWMPEVRVESK